MATWGTGLSLRGVQGIAGQRGGQIFFITGQPTDSNASDVAGDVAFAEDTQLIYQRGPSGWPANGVLLKGAMGLNGVDGGLYAGMGPPDSGLGAGKTALYVQSTGEVWMRQPGDSAWTDTNETLVGPAGVQGNDGLRGSQIYHGIGAPPSDPSTLSPPGASGDTYFDVDPNNPNRPVQYFLS